MKRTFDKDTRGGEEAATSGIDVLGIGLRLAVDKKHDVSSARAYVNAEGRQKSTTVLRHSKPSGLWGGVLADNVYLIFETQIITALLKQQIYGKRFYI